MVTLGPIENFFGPAQRPKMPPVFSDGGQGPRTPSKMTFFIDTDPEDSESDSNPDEDSPTYSTESVRPALRRRPLQFARTN